MPDDIHVAIAGAQVRFRTNSPALAVYAREHLAPLATAADGEPEISSELVWVEGLPPDDPDAIFPGTRELDRIDRDVYRGETSLVWMRIDDFRHLKLQVSLDGERLKVTGRYYFHLSNRPGRDAIKRILYWRRLAAERRRAYTTLLYYLVYYPALWWLETRRGIHPLHGGAVATPHGGVLLAGLGAVGKSTLTVGLTALDDVRFLSDTFILYDRHRIYPMVEPVLLDARSRKWLGAGVNHLIEMRMAHNHGYGRRAFHVERGRCTDSARLALVLLPYRAPRASARRLTAEQCASRIVAANEISKDVSRYWVFSAALSLLHASGILMERRILDLAAVLDRAESYELGFPPGMPRETLVAHALALLPRREPGVPLLASV